MAVQIRTGQVAGLDEQIRDVIGAALVAGSGVSITVDDAANTITIDTSGAAGGGELLVMDGSTSGELLTLEDGSDVLYEG